MSVRPMNLAAWVVWSLLSQAPHVWNVPDVLEVVNVPGRTEAGGLPVAMHAVRSRADVETLRRALEKQFIDAGLYLPPERDVPQLSQHPQLTGLDVDRQISYTAFLQRNPDRTVTVIFTETFVKERKTAAPEVPVMPGATSVLTSKAETMSSVSYRVKASADEVRRFYTEVMGAAGFKPEKKGSLRFSKGADVWTVSTRPGNDGDVAVSVLKGLDPTFAP